jgi:hypothetical protein
MSQEVMSNLVEEDDLASPPDVLPSASMSEATAHYEGSVMSSKASESDLIPYFSWFLVFSLRLTLFTAEQRPARAVLNSSSNFRPFETSNPVQSCALAAMTNVRTLFPLHLLILTIWVAASEKCVRCRRLRKTCARLSAGTTKTARCLQSQLLADDIVSFFPFPGLLRS